jgi:hypothetical protein
MFSKVSESFFYDSAQAVRFHFLLTKLVILHRSQPFSMCIIRDPFTLKTLPQTRLVCVPLSVVTAELILYHPWMKYTVRTEYVFSNNVNYLSQKKKKNY